MTKEIDTLDQREQELISKAEELWSRMEATQIGRSRVQFRNFVISAHDTLPRQWYQAMIEAEGQFFEMHRVRLEVERLGLQLEKMKEEYDNIISTDTHKLKLMKNRIEQKELEYAQAHLTRLRLVRQCELIWEVLQELEEINGGPFTTEEIQNDEARYWAKRLARQAYVRLQGGGGPGDGNLEALAQLMKPVGAEYPDFDFSFIGAVDKMLLPEVKKALLNDKNNGPDGQHDPGND